MNRRRQFRKEVLEWLGATPAEVSELLFYNANPFDLTRSTSFHFPLPDEPFVEVWEHYARTVQETHTLISLSRYLPQLRFPIQAGISQHPDYVAAAHRGEIPAASAVATGLHLYAPQDCRLLIQATPAGRIPILIARERRDFVSLVQAFAKHNEPVSVPEAMGATTVAGYNNWHRIEMLREQFHTNHSEHSSWPAQFSRIRKRRALYQDTFILLSSDGYSGISADVMNFTEAVWSSLSVAMRRQHECTHYFTKRLFSSMQNNILDELIADYMGITAALRHFHADWQLRFFGLERFPNYREGGRLQNYRGTPLLSDGAFTLLQRLVFNAVLNLERFDRRCFPDGYDTCTVPAIITALASLALEELASNLGPDLLGQSLARAAATLRKGAPERYPDELSRQEEIHPAFAK